MPGKRKLPRPKAEGVLVQRNADNAEAITYTELLKVVKQKASAEEVGSKVGHMRKTKKGDLLIELQKGANSEEVSGAIRRAVGDQLLVRPLLPTVTMELRELEDGTKKAEVHEAVVAALGDANLAQIKVKSLRKGPRGTQVALVLAPRAIASAKILMLRP